MDDDCLAADARDFKRKIGIVKTVGGGPLILRIERPRDFHNAAASFADDGVFDIGLNHHERDVVLDDVGDWYGRSRGVPLTEITGVSRALAVFCAAVLCDSGITGN